MTQPSERETVEKLTRSSPNPFPEDFPQRDWVWEYLKETVGVEAEKRIAQEAREAKRRAENEFYDDEPSGHWTDSSDDLLNNGGEPWNDPNQKDFPFVSLEDDDANELKDSLTPEQQAIWGDIERSLRWRSPFSLVETLARFERKSKQS